MYDESDPTFERPTNSIRDTAIPQLTKASGTSLGASINSHPASHLQAWSGSPPSSLDNINVPVRMGKYLLDDGEGAVRVGKGRFGAVYRAVDKDSGEVVALKLAATSVSFYRVEEEAGMLRFLSHPCIPRYISTTSAADAKGIVSHAIAMSFHEGKTLKDLLKNGVRFSLEQVMKYSKELLGIVHYLHTEGVAHLDLHMGNVLLGDDDRIYLLDFGNALRGLLPYYQGITSDCVSMSSSDLNGRWIAAQQGMVVDYYGVARTACSLYHGFQPDDLGGGCQSGVDRLDTFISILSHPSHSDRWQLSFSQYDQLLGLLE